MRPEKCEYDGGDASDNKRARKSYTLKEKMDIIYRIQKGERPKDIGIALNMAVSTICTIFKNREWIQKRYEIENGAGLLPRVTRARHPILEVLENRLLEWMNIQTQELNGNEIRDKALEIFDELKQKMLEEGDATVCEVDFKASLGWYERFKHRSGQKSAKIVIQPDTNDDFAASMNFIEKIKKIVEEGKFSLQRIFNIKETRLYWKHLPSSDSSFNIASKDYVTILTGSNCSGDAKLKPLVVYHTETPRGLKGMLKSSLPVIWKSNPKGCMTEEIFSDYIHSYLSPFVAEYSKKTYRQNKALLIIDTAPCHPPYAADICDNIQVVFLPPGSSSILQPMLHGGFMALKAQYMQCLVQYLTKNYDSTDQNSLSARWSKLNMKHCVEFIDEALKNVRKETLNGCWRNLFPQYVPSSKGSEEINEVKKNIAALSIRAGIEILKPEDIDQLLQTFEDDEGDETINLEDYRKLEEENEAHEENSCKGLDGGVLKEILDTLDYVTNIAMENDIHMSRSLAFKNAITSATQCYRELYERKLQTQKQMSIPSTYIPVIVETSYDIPSPSTSGAEHYSIKTEPSESFNSDIEDHMDV
ncbi:hypothetical protein QYM36_006333 [Artemia franciscana]|uniref:HTH CENPB-type domain-containing protein n=1 Tax=Artemia franciscana TaxID=6661 RepID=A0AA88HWE4_ARTSF|nr:hypothetical protein QYM36_006333 [Artemia franciscana]